MIRVLAGEEALQWEAEEARRRFRTGMHSRLMPLWSLMFVYLKDLFARSVWFAFVDAVPFWLDCCRCPGALPVSALVRRTPTGRVDMAALQARLATETVTHPSYY